MNFVVEMFGPTMLQVSVCESYSLSKLVLLAFIWGPQNFLIPQDEEKQQ